MFIIVVLIVCYLLLAKWNGRNFNAGLLLLYFITS